MLRWLRIGVLMLLGIAAISFIGDFAVFRMRGSPQKKLSVSHFVSAPLKDNKEEIDYLGSVDTPCSITLYPQDGMAPCWYLRRHLNQVSNY